MNWWVKSKKRFTLKFYSIYINYFCVLASTFTGCISISVFVSLIGIPTRTTSFAVVLKISTLIKRYKPIIKKKKKKHDKIIFLAKSKLNKIEVFIFEAKWTKQNERRNKKLIRLTLNQVYRRF